MTRGGARRNSGPAPDPNALRRDRRADAEWIDLPSEGRQGATPKFPFSGSSPAERAMWARLWKRPQAVMWERLDMGDEVAAYVRAYLESVEPGASAGLKTAVLRMAAEIGLSLPGMHSLRWRIATDQLAERRNGATDETKASPARADMRSRLKAVSNGG